MQNTHSQLIKKLLPGLLPIIVFIFVDAFWSTKAGLIVAIVFGVVQLFAIYFKEKKWDKFVIFDTALLCLFGVVSIVLENEIFFKLKPFIISAILAALIGISVFGKKNFIMLYSQHIMKGIEINEEAQKNLKEQLQVLFWIVSIHAVLVLYSSFFLSKAAWAFISGALLYILIGIYVAWMFLLQYLKKRQFEKTAEWLPYINENGEIIGKVPRKIAHTDKKYLHPVVHTHIVDANNNIYLQKRSPNKKVEPNKWDTAAGGHVDFGESIDQALMRETKEEIGIENFSPKLFARYVWETDRERELVFSFIAEYTGEINFNRDEVCDGRYWSLKEVKENIGKGVFSPNLEYELPHVIQWIENRRK